MKDFADCITQSTMKSNNDVDYEFDRFLQIILSESEQIHRARSNKARNENEGHQVLADEDGVNCSQRKVEKRLDVSAIDDSVEVAPNNAGEVETSRPEIVYDDDAPFQQSQLIAAAYESMDNAKGENENTNSIEGNKAMPGDYGDVNNTPALRESEECPTESHPEIAHHSIALEAPTETRSFPGAERVNGPCSLGSDRDRAEGMMHHTPRAMLPNQNDGTTFSSVPIPEATCVQESGQSVHEMGGISRYCRRHQKYILTVLTALVFGTLIATVAFIVGSPNKENDDNLNEDGRGDIPELAASTVSLYYADRSSKRCDNDPSRRPGPHVRQRSFATIEECCRTEFWLQANQCMLSSLDIHTNIPTAETSSTTASETTSVATSTTSSSTTISTTTAFTPKASTTILPALTSSSSSLASNAWRQLGQTIVGDAAGDQAGSSVVLSSDCKTLAIGAPGAQNNEDRPGYVKVYHKDARDSSWKQLGQDIVGKRSGDLFGSSSALSKDGRTLAIGAPGHRAKSDRPGYVRVYHMGSTGLSWKQLGQDIPGQSVGDQFGISVSLSSDGKTLAIGADTNDDNGHHSGQVRVYLIEYVSIVGMIWKQGTSWKQFGQEINGEAYTHAGNQVALSGDGNTLAIGAYLNDGNGIDSGHVRIYGTSDVGIIPSWKQVGQDIDGQASDLFGLSVDLSSDADSTSRSGYVRVYHRDGDDSSSSFQQLGQDIVGEAQGSFGTSVALSQDGMILAVGDNNNGDNGANSGHVRVYHMDDSSNSQWTQLARGIDGEKAGDNAGWMVSLSADGKTLAR